MTRKPEVCSPSRYRGNFYKKKPPGVADEQAYSVVLEEIPLFS